MGTSKIEILHLESGRMHRNGVGCPLSESIVARLQSDNLHAKLTFRDLSTLPSTRGTPANLSDTALVEEFLRADVIVVGIRSYGFNISADLKAWLDLVVIAGKTFRYGTTGVKGLV